MGRAEVCAPASGGEGLRLTQISAYQGVKIPLTEDGVSAAPRATPVVAGRPALIRVFLGAGEGWVTREVDATLELSGGATNLRATKRVTGSSTEEDLESTINFDVPAGAITPQTKFSVSVADPSGCPWAEGGESSIRFPETGDAGFDAASLAGPLRVVIVPVEYTADGSGRVPDVSPERIRLYAERMFAHLPVDGVQIDVRAPFRYGSRITRGGYGWTRFVDAVTQLRANDNVDPDVYYYGLVSPADTFSAYCAGSCVVGQAYDIPDEDDEYARAAVGVGFPDESLSETFVHEMGHTLGRRHSPCGGAAGADQLFPYSSGSIGVWGFDLVERELKDPAQYRDFMSYCEPTWTSDYSYGRVFERLSAVVGSRPRPAASVAYRTIIVEADGSLSWGHRLERRSRPSGDEVLLKLLDGEGNPVDSRRAFGVPMADAEGRIYFMEERGKSAATPAFVEIPGAGRLAL